MLNTFQQTTKAIFSTNRPISLFALAYKHFNLKCNFLLTSTNTYNILKEGINWILQKRKKFHHQSRVKYYIYTLKNNDVFGISILRRRTNSIIIFWFYIIFGGKKRVFRPPFINGKASGFRFSFFGEKGDYPHFLSQSFPFHCHQGSAGVTKRGSLGFPQLNIIDFIFLSIPSY